MAVIGAFPVRCAAACLRAGGVVAHATEAVFGLAARCDLESACHRVAELKQRGHGKSFIIIGFSRDQLASLVSFENALMEDIEASWPGPNTWLLPAGGRCPAWLVGPGGRVAVRVTGHPQAAALCRAAGPLISTSANAAGRPPARTLLAARRYFGRAVDHYLAGQLGASTRPSRIRDGLTGNILRA